MAQPATASTPAPPKPDWAAIAKSPKFQELHHKKSRFLLGWWLFSTAFYFGLPLAAGATTSQSDFWNQKVIGPVPLLYMYALAQYALCLVIAIYYGTWANRVSDRITRELVEELKVKGGVK